jgi:uroporphyrinogen-III synthase
LVTRPEPGCTTTASRVAALGHRPVIAPFLVVRDCHVPLPAPDRVQAVIAASARATALPAYTSLPFLAVGNATAAAARAAGFATIHSADGDAVALVALAARSLDPAHGPLLLATARGQGTRLAAALRAAGFLVHRRAVYAATSIRQFPPRAAEAIRDGLDAALFFSAETARAFARLLPRTLRDRLAHTTAVVIGNRAAEALQHLPFRELRVAVRPTQDEVLALL